MRLLAGALLAHCNVLITLYGGAALATAARLRWDASTYVAARLLFPAEYRALAAALPVLGVALPLLAHLATVALQHPRVSRCLLGLYCALMCALLAGEVALLAWLAQRLAAWLLSDRGALLIDSLKLVDKLIISSLGVLKHIDKKTFKTSFPINLDLVYQEAKGDAPCNLYAAVVAGTALLALQLLAAAAALVAARDAPLPQPSANARQAPIKGYFNKSKC